MILATAQTKQSIKSNQIKSNYVLFLFMTSITLTEKPACRLNLAISHQSIFSAYVALHPSFAYIKATTPATTPTNVATTTDDFITMPLEGAPP